MSLVLKQWSGNRSEVAFQGLQFDRFPLVAAVGAGVALTTVQGRLLLPVAVKIQLVAVYFSAIQALDGGHEFNISVGTGVYETAPVAATGTVTIAGAATTGKNITVTVGGNAVVTAETTGDSATTTAANVRDAINADVNANKLVVATSALGVVTTTALAKGSLGNGITLVAAADAGGSTAVASGATLTGGTEGSAITTAPTDNSISGPPPGGLGVPTVFAAAGQALFAADKALTAAAGVGVPAAIGPVLAAPTTGAGGVLRFVPDVTDAVYPAGTLLTLRALTPATVGSITNLLVTLAYLPVRTRQSITAGEYLVTPGVDY